jgi:hypothetical protein
VKQSVRRRRWTPDVYGRNLMVGVRKGSRFDLDRRFRLYQESEQAKMTVTQANAVTAAARKS